MPKYGIPIFIVIIAVSNIYAQIEPQYPVPVSENAEKVGPNTMTFLSYPKYYRTANNELTPVVTNLVRSKTAGWDYEVTTGIWSLYVKTDGTFRADHAGDSFTYQFSDIGIGSGKDFKSLNLGKLNWENIRVMGETIRWNDVLPNVDVSVRYIHDILKVDVIAKKVLMRILRIKTQNGEISADDFLTAKFNITGVLLNSQAKQGDQVRDLYAEATEINQPLQFWKEDKVVHTLRPVEAYVLDDSGKRLDEAGIEFPIHTAQRWILSQTAPGEAEMSANLGDLLKAPEGEVVIDPSITFGNYYGDSCVDAYIDQLFPTATHGTEQYLSLTSTTNAERRIVIGFNIGTKIDDRIITSARIKIYNNSISGTAAADPVHIFKKNTSWVEATVNWNSGQEFEATKYVGFGSRLPTSSGSWVEFDATQPFRYHFKTSKSDLLDKGFELKIDPGSCNAVWSFYSTNYNTVYLRPELWVFYSATQFGAGGGPNRNDIQNWTDNDRLTHAQDDKFNLVRITGQRKIDQTDEQRIAEVVNYCSLCYNRTPKVSVSICFPAGWTDYRGFYPASQYAAYIHDMLEDLSSPVDYINNGTVISVELGGEEDVADDIRWATDEKGATETGGSQYAGYYLAAWDIIKENIDHPNWKKLKVMGGCMIDWKQLVNKIETGPTEKFLKGFLDTINTASSLFGMGKG